MKPVQTLAAGFGTGACALLGAALLYSGLRTEAVVEAVIGGGTLWISLGLFVVVAVRSSTKKHERRDASEDQERL